jgi:hypothetical protein
MRHEEGPARPREPRPSTASGPGSGQASAGQEAQPDTPDGIVAIGVEQGDRLPRPEGRASLDHGDRDGRRGEERQDVIGPVAG